MEQNQGNKIGNGFRRSRLAEIANSFEWFITALILALFFRAFIIEPYRIPTGSMANTLIGEHFRLRCKECGYQYDFGVDPEDNRLRVGDEFRARCPACGRYTAPDKNIPVSSGDRILVLKCLYNFFQPKRWEVIVFNNPQNPAENYIKRLVALPGETVEILDGDIYINGRIARKPAHVRQRLWVPVYNSDYRPVHPNEYEVGEHTRRQPFRSVDDSGWTRSASQPGVLTLGSQPGAVSTLRFDKAGANDFKVTRPYNNPDNRRNRPYCSDLMFRCCVRFQAGGSRFGVELSKYGTTYRASIDDVGNMVLSSETRTKLKEKRLTRSCDPGRVLPIKFANVDHKLVFKLGEHVLTCDLGRLATSVGPVRPDIQPELELFGTGSLSISHLEVYRDIHYMSQRGGELARAADGKPFTLADGQYFVLGDNSLRSEDSRWWSGPGRGNNGRSFSAGILPQEYLVGKAICVYWPSCFRPFGKDSFVFVPDIASMRLIYGGTGRE